MKNHAVIFNWSQDTGLAVQMEFAICTNVEKFAIRAIRQGFSVYLGIIEYDGKMYWYTVAFAGIAQLIAIQDTGLVWFQAYARDLLSDGLREDLELCEFSGDGDELRKEI